MLEEKVKNLDVVVDYNEKELHFHHTLLAISGYHYLDYLTPQITDGRILP